MNKRFVFKILFVVVKLLLMLEQQRVVRNKVLRFDLVSVGGWKCIKY